MTLDLGNIEYKPNTLRMDDNNASKVEQQETTGDVTSGKVASSSTSGSVFTSGVEPEQAGDNLQLGAKSGNVAQKKLDEEAAMLVDEINSRVSEENRKHQIERQARLKSGKKLSRPERRELFKKDVEMAEERLKVMEEMAKDDPDLFKKLLNNFENLSVADQQALLCKFVNSERIPSEKEAKKIAETLEKAPVEVQRFAARQIKHIKRTNRPFYDKLVASLDAGLKAAGKQWTHGRITSNQVSYLGDGVEDSENKELQQSYIDMATSARPEDVDGQNEVCQFIVDSKMTEDEENRKVFANALPNLPPELQSKVHNYAYDAKNFDSTEDRNRLISQIQHFTAENQLKSSSFVMESSKTEQANLKHLKTVSRNFDNSVKESVSSLVEQKLQAYETAKSQPAYELEAQAQVNAQNDIDVIGESVNIFERAAVTKDGASQDGAVVSTEKPTNLSEFLAALKSGSINFGEVVKLATAQFLSSINSFDINLQDKILASASYKQLATMCAQDKFSGRAKMKVLSILKNMGSENVNDIETARQVAQVYSYGQLKIAAKNVTGSREIKNIFVDAMETRFVSHVREEKANGTFLVGENKMA